MSNLEYVEYKHRKRVAIKQHKRYYEKCYQQLAVFPENFEALIFSKNTSAIQLFLTCLTQDKKK